MQAHTTPAFAVSITPGERQIPAPAHAVTGSFTVKVTDAGSQPIKVQMQTMRLGAKSACTQHNVTWLTVASKPYTLKSGQSKTVPVTVHLSAGESGNAAVLAVATPAKTTAGSFKLGAGVGSRVVLGTGKNAVCSQAQPVIRVTPHASGGLPMGVLVAIVVLAALVVAGVVFGLKRRHQS